MRGSRHATASAAARRSASSAGGLAEERGHQLAAPAAALALELRAGLGVAFDRVGRERLDVGEDRLGEQAEHVGLDARPRGGGGQPPPGDPRAHAIGGLQRVQRAALAQLAAAERDVDLAPGPRAPDGLRISSTNCRSASVTPVRTPRPNEPSSGRA